MSSDAHGGPRTYAEILKEKADKKHADTKNAEALRIYYLAIKKAEEAAESGSYSTDLYDDGLRDHTIHTELKRQLKNQGFKATIFEDDAYTKHAGQVMICLQIRWD